MVYKHYFIAVYDDEDYIMFTADTWKELADILGKKRNNVRWQFSHYFKGDRKSIIIKGKRCKAYLIDLKENEDGKDTT